MYQTTLSPKNVKVGRSAKKLTRASMMLNLHNRLDSFGAAITGNELCYASAKATEATAPEAAEASTAAPSRRIGGTRFSVNERVAKKPRLSGASVAFEADPS
jgi:hypothetical protein